jgi:hypothetical protein
MTDSLSIRLNRLVDSTDDVRKTAGADSTLQALAWSVTTHGFSVQRDTEKRLTRRTLGCYLRFVIVADQAMGD